SPLSLHDALPLLDVLGAVLARAVDRDGAGVAGGADRDGVAVDAAAPGVEADRAVLQPRHVDADGVAALSVERLRRLARGDDLGAADAERPGERELGGAAADLGEAEEAAVGDVRDVLVVAEEAGRAHAEEGVADDLEGALAGELLPLAGGDAEEGPRLERLPEHDGLLG